MAGRIRFRKLISRFRFRKVRSRFFAAMILLSLPPLFLLGYVSFNIARDTLMDNNTKTNNDHLQTSSEVADLLLRSIVNLNRFIVLNDEIRNDLRESEIKTSEERSEMNRLTINRLQRIINSNSFDTRYMDSLCVFDLHYQTYCWGRSDDAGKYEIPNKKEAVEQSDWYRQAVEAQGRVVFFPYNVLGDNADSFSAVKLFRDSESPEGKPIGLLVTNLSKSMFGSVFNGSEDNGSFLAIDSSSDPARIVYPEPNRTSPPIAAGSLQQMIGNLEKQGYLISEFRNQTTQWTFVHLIRKSRLLQQSSRIGTATAWIASALALVALAISFVVSGSITRPLLQLKKMMIEWNKGSREIGGTFQEDEVGAIGETFKRMALENQELDARLFHSELKEREAELRALQAQIKPHFLYNTLDSIYLMARLHRTEEAAAMALALSESFKLSLNKGRETIPVFKELKHIEHYMTIQNIRYNGRFRYEADVDPGVLGFEMLKLVLQPLVENAIYHGLEPKVGEGSVRIEGRRDGDFLFFAVEDDGVGMDDVLQTEQGYGLRNVRERLTLYYGPSSSFLVSSRPGRGTRIEIRIKPFAEEVRKNA
ncbi:cache domain-containing sensor histidine kinase [Cohnella zeiphila]|uniref:Sensor histidine kinase n=1 Tax=Cohnella zeiphila TaxID=2761120 RepID=A0A7X0SKR0_9BACL|nr:sensor histidine kinase [Cohnella zeiphila]MBB6731689.1 sensor histidine kinase [Cohnella zeiphila]